MHEENHTAHLAALERARAALGAFQPTLDRPVTVHLLNMAAISRNRPYSNLIVLKISDSSTPSREFGRPSSRPPWLGLTPTLTG